MRKLLFFVVSFTILISCSVLLPDSKTLVPYRTNSTGNTYTTHCYGTLQSNGNVFRNSSEGEMYIGQGGSVTYPNKRSWVAFSRYYPTTVPYLYNSLSLGSNQIVTNATLDIFLSNNITPPNDFTLRVSCLYDLMEMWPSDLEECFIDVNDRQTLYGWFGSAIPCYEGTQPTESPISIPLGQVGIDKIQQFLRGNKNYLVLGLSELGDDASAVIYDINENMNLGDAITLSVQYETQSAADISISDITSPDIVSFLGGGYSFLLSNLGDLQLEYVITSPNWISISAGGFLNGGLQETIPFTISQNTSSIGRTGSITITNSDNPNDYYAIIVTQEGMQQPSLLNGIVNPSPGTVGENFVFEVMYTDPTGNQPSDVLLKLTNQTYNMTYYSGNISSGAVYKYETLLNVADIYAYHFEANSGQQRFPETVGEFLYLTVNQSTAGWDAMISVNNTNIQSPSTIEPGDNITVQLGAKNNGSYTYNSLPVSISLLSPTGSILDTSSGTIYGLDPNNIDIIDLIVTLPSNAVNGIYNIECLVEPLLDSDWSNNSTNISFFIGEEIESDVYLMESQEWAPASSMPYNFTVNGLGFQIIGVNTSQDYIVVKDNNNDYEEVYTYEIDFFDNDTYVICKTVSGSGVLFNYGHETNTNVPNFVNAQVSGYKGSSVCFRATAPSNYDFENGESNYEFFRTGEDNTEPEVASWFDEVIEVNNGYHTVDFKFDIPSSASTGNRVFFFLMEYQQSNSPTHIARLELNVLTSPPSITTLNDYTISADDELTINGADFGSNGNIYFGSVQCPSSDIISWHSSSITCIVPEGIQNGTLYITNNNGSSNSIAYSVVSSTGDPELSQPIPDQSMTAGTTRVISDLTTTFWNPNSDNLTYDIVYSSTNITHSITDTILSINANDNINEIISITVQASDPDTTISDEFELTVNDINDPPQIDPIPDQQCDEDSILIIEFSYLDSLIHDPDDVFSNLTLAIVNHENFSVQNTGNQFELTPFEDWFGTGIITLSVSDGEYTVPQNINIIVDPINDPPYFVFPNLVFDEDSTATYNFNDIVFDVDNTLVDSCLTWTGNDTIQIVKNGWYLTFSSNIPDWHGTDDVTFTIDDFVVMDRNARNLNNRSSRSMTSETVPITAISVDDEIVVNEVLPVADSLTIYEDESLGFTFSGYDPDGNQLEYSWLLDGSEVSIDSTYILTTDYTSAGNYIVNLEVTDNFGVLDCFKRDSCPSDNILNYTWNVEVIDVDQPIVVNDLSFADSTSGVWQTINQNINENDTLYFFINAYDPDDNTLEYCWRLDGVEMTSDSIYCFATDYLGALSSINSPFNVTLDITDNFSTTSRNKTNRNNLFYEWEIIVNDVDQNIVVDSLSHADSTGGIWQTIDQDIDEGDSLNFFVSAYDPDGNQLDYAWLLDGDSVSVTNVYTFLTDWQSGEDDYVISLNFTDNFGSSDNELNFEWNVHVNDTVGSGSIIIPMVTKLYKNFPNPFNPTTTINFSIKSDSKVQIEIYNIKGQKVKQLVSDQLLAGQHSIIWNGRNEKNKSVSSGIYFYRMRTDDFDKMRKMLLLK